MVNFFKKASPEDALQELKHKIFKEDKINNIFKDIDINTKFSDGDNFLHKIIPSNNIESVKFLIHNKINVNEQNFEGDTPLHIAARFSFSDTLLELLNANADCTKTNNKGKLAIQEAITTNHFNNYKLLSKDSINFQHFDKEGNSLLSDAISVNNSEIIQDLIEVRGLKIDKSSIFKEESFKDINFFKLIKKYVENLDLVDDNGKSLLFYVIDYADNIFEFLEYCLDSLNIDINLTDKNGDNILLYLIKKINKLNKNEYDDEKEKIKLKVSMLMKIIPDIIEKGIDASCCNEDNDNVLTLVVKSLNKELLEILLDFEINPNIATKDQETALSIAALIGNKALEEIYLLLDYGADPNIKDSNNKTIIEKLIDVELYKKSGKKLPISERRKIEENSDYLNILDVILANGEVRLTDINSNKEPYFFEPISYGNIHLMKLLIKYGADINQHDQNNLNIIYKLIAENKTFRRESDQKRYYTNLKAVIGLGANVNSKDSYGGITLHKAILECDINTVKIILHSGADINAVDNRGRNMIHNCIWQNKIKTFRLIYTFNKKLLNEPDKFGVLPINYAAFLGYTDMVLELIRTGSHVNNPYRKTHYILDFLKKFHPNLKLLHENAITKNEKNIIKALIDNMKKEFKVESI